MKFTEEEMLLLDRHYAKIKIFGKVIYFWSTSPRMVLRHLQEIKVKNFVESDVLVCVHKNYEYRMVDFKISHRCLDCDAWF